MKNKEIRGFQSEVKQLLHLMIHSLYSNKEIFLRELISNASDAIDKLRFKELSIPDLHEKNINFRIRISFNLETRSIVISDNGIGMNREEVIENLGTIAKSGTKDFLESISLDQKKNSQIIGQFGVGFYSSFIVSNKVSVYTRAAGTSIDDGVYWESIGEGEYTISNITKLLHGTDITLFLRKEENEFLDYTRLKNIIKKYSDHIIVPIEIQKSIIDNKKENEPQKEQIIWEQINQARALWIRNRTNISNNEYQDFYKQSFNDEQNPLIWSHNRVEGKQEYISLLYIPAHSTLNVWNNDRKYGLKLYVQHVYIMDDSEQVLHNYLRFVKGLIDSNDLPLNVSREILQDNRLTHNLKEAITKRILSMLDKLSKNNEEQYQIFWKNFGMILKEGLAEDTNNNKTIVQLLRFVSTYSKHTTNFISLESYVNRMIEGQEKIYFIISDNYLSAKNNPHLELLQDKNIEVLLLFDRIDEWIINYLPEYNGKLFQSVSVNDLSLDKLININTDEQKNSEEEMKPFIERIKKYLDTRVKSVRITYRLIDTPSVVTTDINDMNMRMAKLLAVTGKNIPDVKYIFEININHTLIKYISNINNDDIFNEWIELLFDQALLSEQGSLDDPNKFILRINKFINHNK